MADGIPDIVKGITEAPSWQQADATGRRSMVRELAVAAMADGVPDEELNPFLSELYDAAGARGAAGWTKDAVVEVAKSVPSGFMAVGAALTDAVGLTDTGSGERVRRGKEDLTESIGQRVKSLAPGDNQEERDRAFADFKADLETGAAPAGVDFYLQHPLGPPQREKKLPGGLSTLEDDPAERAAWDKGRKWLGDWSEVLLRVSEQALDATAGEETFDFARKRGQGMFDTAMPELVADYMATRDPAVWAAIKDVGSEGQTGYNIRKAQEKDLRESGLKPEQSLADDLTARAMSMQSSPIDMAMTAFPLLKGAQALRAARGGRMAQAMRNTAESAAGEFVSEAATEALSDSGRAGAGQILEAGAVGAVGGGVLTGGSAAAGAVLNLPAKRAAEAQSSPSVEAGPQGAPVEAPGMGAAQTEEAASAPAPVVPGTVTRLPSLMDPAGSPSRGGLLEALVVEDPEEVGGEDAETRRGEDAETRRGEDAETRRGGDAETGTETGAPSSPSAQSSEPVALAPPELQDPASESESAPSPLSASPLSASAAPPAPSPGTVASPPVPDTAETVAEQVRLAADPASTRRAVLITPGTTRPAKTPGLKGVQTPHGLLLYNPKKVKLQEAMKAAKAEVFDARILGMSAATGPRVSASPLSASSPSPSPVGVTASTPAAKNVQAELVSDPQNLPAAIAAAQAAAPGARVEVKPAAQVLEERQAEGIDSVYPQVRNGVQKWMVQAGEKRGFGDWIFNTEAEARQEAALQSRRRQDRQAALQKQQDAQRQEDEKRTQQEQKPRAFARDRKMAKVVEERAVGVLTKSASRRSASNQKIYTGTKAAVAEQMLADGYQPVRNGNKFEFNLNDGDSIYDVTKTEFEFAEWLKEQAAPPSLRPSVSPSSSASPAPTTKHGQSAVRILGSKAPEIVKDLRVVANVGELNPADYTPKQWAGIREGGTEGFFHPASGQSVVILDNIQPRTGESPVKAVARVILHERLGHAGLGLLRRSDAKFAQQWENLVARIPAEELMAIASEPGYAGIASDTQALAEEWLARHAERVKLEPPGSPLRQLWDALVAAVRRLMSAFSPGGMTAEQLAASLLKRSRAALSRQTVMPDGAVLEGPMMHSIRAYHGTPHKVDKFTTAKIGTGEGAQAYGWGLYFAEGRDVAASYKDTLAKRAVAVNGVPLDRQTDALANALRSLLKGKLSKDEIIADLLRTKAPWDKAAAEALLDIKPESVSEIEQGNLYTVELLPDAEDFLDWDKPLSEQSEKVKAALRETGLFTERDLNPPANWSPSPLFNSGKGAYEMLVSHHGGKDNGGPAKASQALAALGIPGIQYFDGNSRNLEYGTRNMVVFDEKLVKILEENGQPVDPAQDDIRFSRAPQDAEYLAAVERGDMETAQRMVDAAAKAAIKSNPRNAVKFGRFLSKSEYESAREQIEKMPREVFYVGNVEVIRNPTGDDIRGMTNEERSARGGRRSVDPDTRFTKDNYGNTWRWKATGGMHSMIEPSISRREGVDVNQNNGIPYHSDLVKNAIRSGEYTPSKTLKEYPNYADFVKPSSADPVTRDESGRVIPLSERFNPAQDDIRFSRAPRSPLEMRDFRPGTAVGAYQVKNQITRRLLKGDALPVGMAPVLQRAGYEVEAIKGRMASLTGDLKVAMKDVVKRGGMTAENVERAVQLALTGGRIRILPTVALQDAAREVRNLLDNLSTEVAKITGGTLGETILDNSGQWMRRSYLAFEEEAEWNFDALAAAAAKGKLYHGRDAGRILRLAAAHLQKENPRATPAKIEALMRDLTDRDVLTDSLAGEGPKVSKDVSSLMRRRQIPKVLRELMGEVKDPLRNAMRSVSFQAQFIARHDQQQQLARMGLRSGLFRAKKEGVYNERVGDSTQRWSGFYATTAKGKKVPLYTTPDLMKALREAPAVTQAHDVPHVFLAAIQSVNGIAKMNKVALSPDAAGPQWIGNIVSLIQNGVLLWRDGWRNLAESVRVYRSGKAQDMASLDPVKRALVEMRRGVLADMQARGVTSSASMQDMEATLDTAMLKFVERNAVWDKTVGFGHGLLIGQSMGKAGGSTGRVIGGAIGGAVGAVAGEAKVKGALNVMAQWVVGHPDRIGKMTDFLTNLDAELASGIGTREQAMDRAAQKTLDTMPSYEKILKFLRDLSKFGVLNSFLAFKYELVRNTYHNLRYGVQELRSGNPALMQRGARRLMGAAAVQAALIWGIPALAGLIGSGLDEEEEKAYRKWLTAPWERYANLNFTHFDKEKASFFGAGYLIPQSFFLEMVDAAREDKPLDALGDKVWQDFAEGNVWLDPLLEVTMNAKKHAPDRKITDKKGWAGLLEKIGYYTGRVFEPGAADKIDRLQRAATGRDTSTRQFSTEEELLRLGGFRSYTYTNESRVKSRLYQFREERDAITAAARSQWAGNAPGVRETLVQETNARLEAMDAEFQEFREGMKTLGLGGMAAGLRADTGFKPGYRVRPGMVDGQSALVPR